MYTQCICLEQQTIFTCLKSFQISFTILNSLMSTNDFNFYVYFQTVFVLCDKAVISS